METAELLVRQLATHRQLISNVQVFSPWHWHFVSVTLGLVPPWRRIDSMK